LNQLLARRKVGASAYRVSARRFQARVSQPHRRDHHLFNLSQEQIGAIVEIQLRRLAKRLAERKITLELTESARQQLIALATTRAMAFRPSHRKNPVFILTS
jgi:DNA gyrase/topoisomerase IV subunit A